MHFRNPSKAVLRLGMLGLALVASGAEAIPVYDTDVAPVDWTGSRVEIQPPFDIHGIITGDIYLEDEPLFTIGWEINDLGGGQYSYAYMFSGFSDPSISHFILDLSDDCLDSQEAKAGCVNGADPDVPLLFGEYGPDGMGNSNPGFPMASIAGVKFDDLPNGTTSISFLSNRAPVWGNFYLKGGRDSFAYNTGLVDHMSENVNDFIARPNGLEINAVPEPGSLLLLGSGLLGLALRRFRAR